MLIYADILTRSPHYFDILKILIFKRKFLICEVWQKILAYQIKFNFAKAVFNSIFEHTYICFIPVLFKNSILNFIKILF